MDVVSVMKAGICEPHSKGTRSELNLQDLTELNIGRLRAHKRLLGETNVQAWWQLHMYLANLLLRFLTSP